MKETEDNKSAIMPMGAGKICPHLGMMGDSDTSFAYPSMNNFCHRVSPVERVSYIHQETVCLTPEHEKCPVFQEDWKGALPDTILAEDITGKSSGVRYGWFWGLLAFIIVVGALVGGYLLSKKSTPIAQSASETAEAVLQDAAQATDMMLNLPAGTVTPSLSPTIRPTETFLPTYTSTQTATPSDTPTLSETPTETPVPTITFTPPPTRGPKVGTPFGSEVIYVLHRVGRGQSMVTLASLFDTTEDVIRAANVLQEGRTIWPGDIIVIPIGQKDPEAVIRFTYLLVEKNTLLSELANNYSVSVDEIRYHNDLGDDDWVPVGRWLIIPVSE
jgi:hypothetical protein